MNLSDLNAKQIGLISEGDRKKLGKVAWTPEECREKAVVKLEKELQNQVSALLTRRGIWFDCDAMMHRKRVGTVGAPDYQFPYLGHYVAWECKIESGRLSEAQDKAARKITEQGGLWCIIRSLAQAQDHLKEIENL